MMKFFAPFIVVLCLAQYSESKNFVFKGVSSEAKDWFNEMSSLENIQSRIECAHFLMAESTKSKNASRAFHYNKQSKTCHLGNIGPFGGDVDQMPSNLSDPAAIHMAPNCSAKTINLGQNLLLYYSYMDDNPQRMGIVNLNGSYERLKNPVIDGITDYENWPAAELANLDKISFVMPRASAFPAYFDLTRQATIMFQTQPLNVASFSIFAWMYNPITHYDGILAFSTTDNFQKPAFNFFMGHSSQTGRPQIGLNLAGTMKRYVGIQLTTTNVWTYIGVVFNSLNATLKFYADGLQHGSTINADSGFIGYEWYNLQYLFLGTEYTTVRKPWSPRATVELHNLAMNDLEVENHSFKAKYFLEDPC